MAQQQKQQDIPEFDYIRMLFHCLHHWYWFVLCVAICVGIAVLSIQMKTNVFSTYSTIMIRTDNNMSRSSLQTDMLELMGYQTSKIIGDEMQIITSHAIMEQVVRSLNLQTEYRKKVGLRWVGQYPNSDVLLTFEPGVLDTLQFLELVLERTESDYELEVNYRQVSSKIHIRDLHNAIPTHAGLLTITERKVLKVGDVMRMVTMPVFARASQQLGALSCNSAKKESNVIIISMNSDMPMRSRDVINKLVELYNLDAVIDKNIMATNTANFIDERLRIVKFAVAWHGLLVFLRPLSHGGFLPWKQLHEADLALAAFCFGIEAALLFNDRFHQRCRHAMLLRGLDNQGVDVDIFGGGCHKIPQDYHHHYDDSKQGLVAVEFLVCCHGCQFQIEGILLWSHNT